jgi:transcriptional regulator with XRE-family HTH domain
MKRLGEKVRTLRKREGWTQTQLAEILGVDQSHIVKLEKGDRTPSLEILIKLTQIFQVTSDQLIMDDQEVD